MAKHHGDDGNAKRRESGERVIRSATTRSPRTATSSIGAPVVKRYGLSAIGILIGAGAWEWAGVALDQPTQFAPLSATLVRVVELTLDGSLPQALASSLLLYAIGLASAIMVGYIMGILLARSEKVRVSLESYLVALYATPMVALIPFLLAILGFGLLPKSIIVFLFAFFPVFFNTLEGAKSLSKELVEVARAFNTVGFRLWREVILPATLPYAMTGVRQAMAVGLVGVISAEFFLSSTGLGQIILGSAQRFDAAAILACSLVLALIGVLVMAAGRAIENHFARWRV